jgi:hypothetical protein
VIRRTLLQPVLRAQFGESASLIALAAAGVWAVHPLVSSAVDYLSQRTEVLAGLFYLVTLYAFIRSVESARSVRWAGFAVLACLLGMASKESMVTAPFMVLLYDRTFVAGTLREALRRRFWLHAALMTTWLALAAFMAGARLSARGIGYNLGVPWLNYALTECRALLLYLKLSLWPHPLVFDYGWPFVRTVGNALPAASVLLGLAALVAWALRRKPILGFTGAWFFVLLAPSSSVVPLTEQPIAESRAFLALAAITTLLVAASFAWAGRRALLVWAAVSIALGAATLRRHDDFRTPVALWSDTVAKRPENPRAHNNLGAALSREPGREHEARGHFATAIRLRPDYADAHNNLGTDLLRTGQAQEAIERFEDARRINPQLADAHYNLGTALASTGRGREAVVPFRSGPSAQAGPSEVPHESRRRAARARPGGRSPPA